MQKTLKEVIRGEPMDTKIIDKVDFEILGNIKEDNTADKFDLYYIQSIEDIIRSIDKREEKRTDRKIIYIIENKGFMENFEMINVKELEQIIIYIGLPKKKGTKEGITSDILKEVFYKIKDKFMEIINYLL